MRRATVRVAVIDKQEAFRAGVRQALQDAGFLVIAEGSTLREVELLTKNARPTGAPAALKRCAKTPSLVSHTITNSPSASTATSILFMNRLLATKNSSPAGSPSLL